MLLLTAVVVVVVVVVGAHCFLQSYSHTIQTGIQANRMRLKPNPVI